MDYSKVRGFNYQPSYGGNAMELWKNFDEAVVRKELSLGKKYFPGFNTVRLWLSWNYWKYDKAGCLDKIKRYFAAAEDNDLMIVPVLFNRWHDQCLDWGGIYFDHLIKQTCCEGIDLLEFAEDVTGLFANSDSILAWDICNEPFNYSFDGVNKNIIEELKKLELDWLTDTYHAIKAIDTKHPVSVSPPAFRGIEDTVTLNDISDVHFIHPYFWDDVNNIDDRKKFENLLDEFAAYREKTGKPMLVTETCWGSTDDAKRVQVMEYTLGECKKRGFGWLAHALTESYVADLHGPDKAPISSPGIMYFIDMHGNIRPGHKAFNNY